MLSADLGKVALWASQRRLCLALNLSAAAKEAAMKLDFGAGNRAGQTRVSVDVHLPVVGLSPVYLRGNCSFATLSSRVRQQSDEAWVFCRRGHRLVHCWRATWS